MADCACLLSDGSSFVLLSDGSSILLLHDDSCASEASFFASSAGGAVAWREWVEDDERRKVTYERRLREIHASREYQLILQKLRMAEEFLLDAEYENDKQEARRLKIIIAELKQKLERLEWLAD